MEGEKLSRSFKYWVLAYVGFVLVYLLALTLPKLNYTGDSQNLDYFRHTNTYYVLEGVTCASLAYILSYIILIYFDRFWNFTKPNKKVIITLVILFVMSQVIYTILIWPLLDLVKISYYDDESIINPITLTQKIRNSVYFGLMFLGWFWGVFVYYGYLYIKGTLLRQVQLEATLNSSRLNTLKGQINPHFMFNSLNNIRGLILEDPKRSRTMLTKLSEMLRFSLNVDEVNFVPIKKELQTVDNYISLAKIQFEERLEYNLILNEVDTEILIPPMVIQLLVENAVKHGISSIKRGGYIRVRLELINNFLHIYVSNSGTLRTESTSTKLGIENIKKRLELLYDGKASFSLKELNNEVLATLKLPQS